VTELRQQTPRKWGWAAAGPHLWRVAERVQGVVHIRGLVRPAGHHGAVVSVAQAREKLGVAPGGRIIQIPVCNQPA